MFYMGSNREYIVREGEKMLKNIEDIIISKARDSEKLEALKQYEDDIKTAKDIILHIVRSARTIILQNLSFLKKKLFLQRFVCMKIRLIQAVTIM